MDRGSHKIHQAFHNGDRKLSSELLLWKREDINVDSIKGCSGDTLLHLACQNGWLDHVKYLIKESGCKPDVRDCGNQTPLHYACHCGHLDIVKYLIEVHNCDIAVATKDYWTPLHYACHYGHSNIVEYILDIPGVTGRKQSIACKHNQKLVKGDTALHLSVRNFKFNVVHLLLSVVKHNPYVRNEDGETPIHLLMSTWSDIGCFNVIRILMTIEQWDPNVRCNTEDDTALHLSGRYRKPKTVHLLLSDAKCDPYLNTRNRRGETPINSIMLALSDSECFDIIRVIVATKQWDPNSRCNSEGDTALHLSVKHHKPRVTRYLLSEGKCDPNVIKKLGGMLIEYLLPCSTDSECIDVIKALLASKQWDPNSSCNLDGDTALHLSVRCHRPRVVECLLSEAKCDPNSTNLNDEIPLQLTTDTDAILDLIRHGANPNNVYKLYGKYVRLKKPLIPPVKVFIIGNSGVGKSTLTEALKIEASFLTRAFTIKRRVTDVDEKTVGIIPHDFESKSYGRVTFYDFAGHREFYSSHTAFLHNVMQGSSPIFLLVVNISTEKDKIKQNILYWLSFIENQCSNAKCASHAIVIGSHADIVISSGDDPQQKVTEISESIKRPFQSSIVKYVDVYPMDCQYPESPGITRLRYCLTEVCNAVRIPEVITFNSHCFHVFLLDKFSTSIAVTIQEIYDVTIKEQNTKEGIARFLPNTCYTICKVCDELSSRGHILFLKNSINIENSWVIIDKAYLLSEVTGTIFAPKDFKQHCQLAESTGVVSLSRLIKHFPGIKMDVLTGFMTHFEFCRQILDNELVELITKHHKSLNNIDTVAVTVNDSECYFLFPGLITQQAPDNLWKQNRDFKYHCGWILQSTGPDQFFSSRFLQVLLLRLAFSFAFVKVEEDESIPAFQRECSIWKNGIFWGEIFGMEVIVEVHSNNKTVTFQSRCHEENLLHCIAQKSHIIRKILQCVQDFCPQIKNTESFIDPSDATKFPVELSKISQYSVQKIAEAVINSNECYPVAVVSSRRIIPLQCLVIFEPYAEIELTVLKNLYHCDYVQISDQVLELLCCNLSRRCNLFTGIFRLKSQSTLPFSLAPEELLTALKQWRDGCEGTYKCLKEKLDQYSIFAGRSIVELSRVPVPLKDDTDNRRGAHIDQMSSGSIADTDKPFPDQVLPDYDVIEMDKTVLPLPTYHETTPKLQANRMEGPGDSEEEYTHAKTKLQIDNKPKLSELQLLKGCGGSRVRVIEGVAYRWKDLAMSLDFDGPRIESIDIGALCKPEEACRQMLVKWLDGDDDLRGPVTWDTLIQSLIDAGLVDMADRLKELISS